MAKYVWGNPEITEITPPDKARVGAFPYGGGVPVESGELFSVENALRTTVKAHGLETDHLPPAQSPCAASTVNPQYTDTRTSADGHVIVESGCKSLIELV